jgi:hypothetical protein
MNSDYRFDLSSIPSASTFLEHSSTKHFSRASVFVIQPNVDPCIIVFSVWNAHISGALLFDVKTLKGAALTTVEWALGLETYVKGLTEVRPSRPSLPRHFIVGV